MVNFSLKKLRVDGEKTVDYTFPIALGTDPSKRLVFKCVPAGTTNKPLIAAALKRSAAKGGGKRKLDEHSIEEGYDENAELFPLFVIRGWGNVFDSDNGQPVPFSVEACEKLLKALNADAPDYVGTFYSWANELDNFRAASSLSGN